MRMGAPEAIGGERLEAALMRLAEELMARYPRLEQILLVGVANGGLALARRLARMLEAMSGQAVTCGVINTSFHRDDIGHRPIPKEFTRTELPETIDGATVILVDDVIQTGRTARAALSELFDQGRPEQVELLVLCDRGNRRLPIEPTYSGLKVEVPAPYRVKLHLGEQASSEDRIIFTES